MPIILFHLSTPIAFSPALTTMFSDVLFWISTLDPIALLAIGLSSALLFCLTLPKGHGFPLLNGRKPFEFSYSRASQRFLCDARNIIKSGLREVSISVDLPILRRTNNLTARPPSFASSPTMGLKPSLHQSTPLIFGIILR